MVTYNLSEELAALDLTEQELRADPCMASCCLKDIKQQRQFAVLKAALLDQDRTTQRQKMMVATMQASGDGPGHASELGESDLDKDDEDDHLRDIRMKRLQQLQAESKATASRPAAQLQHVLEAQLLTTLEDLSGCAVVHLAVSGHQPCDELDQQLESLAYQWQGTTFIRCVFGRRSGVVARLGMAQHEIPALLTCKEGAIIGRAPLDMFGPQGDILEEEVVRFLKRLSVLKSRPPGGRMRHDPDGSEGEASVTSDMESDNDEEGQQGRGECGWGQACETCGRRYPHTHVKAVYGRDEERDSDDDSDVEQ